MQAGPMGVDENFGGVCILRRPGLLGVGGAADSQQLPDTRKPQQLGLTLRTPWRSGPVRRKGGKPPNRNRLTD